MIVNCQLLEVNYNDGTHTEKQSIITWKRENTKFYDYDYKNFICLWKSLEIKKFKDVDNKDRTMNKISLFFTISSTGIIFFCKTTNW